MERWGHGGAMGDDDDVGVLTSTGRAMAALPISPRHSRMLLAAAASPVRGCLAAAVAAAAALSLDSPFLHGDSKEQDKAKAEAGETMTAEEKQRRRKLAHKFHHPHSDALSSARALVVGSLRTIPFTFVSFHTRVGCDVMRLFQLFFFFQTLRYIQCGWFFLQLWWCYR